MGLLQTLFGTNRIIPQTGEINWGAEVTAILSNLLYGVDGLAHKLGTNIALPAWVITSGTIAAAGTLTQTHPVHLLASTGGAVALDGTTAIADGPATKNTVLGIVGTSATNTVRIPNGANTDLNGACVIEAGQAILLLWDYSNSTWREIARAR